MSGEADSPVEEGDRDGAQVAAAVDDGPAASIEPLSSLSQPTAQKALNPPARCRAGARTRPRCLRFEVTRVQVIEKTVEPSKAQGGPAQGLQALVEWRHRQSDPLLPPTTLGRNRRSLPELPAATRSSWRRS